MQEMAEVAERVGAEEAKRTFGELLNRTRFTGQRFLITKHGKPVASLGPIEDGDRDGPNDSGDKGAPCGEG